MRYAYWVICAGVAVAIAGCVTERVVWSPDGTRAAILGDDGLHICDASGKLSPALVPEAGCMAWMPDGKRAVVCRQHPLKTWQEIATAFPDQTEAIKNAEAVRPGLQSATGGWAPFIEDTKRRLRLSNEQLTLALIYLRDHSAETLNAKLGKDDRESFAGLSMVEDVAQIYTLGDSNAAPGAVLYRHANAGKGIHNLRISPNADAVLLAIDSNIQKDRAEPLQLLVVSAEGPKKICELGSGAAYPDWSPDGKYAVFIRPADWNSDQTAALLGILTRQQVTDAKGQLLDHDHLPKPEDLAGLLFGQLSRVRVAHDGRIFFCATEVSLPAAVKDFETQPTIFCFDPGKQSTLTRIVPRSEMHTMGDAAQYFELSPDARFLSVPFDDGRVSVLDIAGGEAQLVQPLIEPEEKDRQRLATIPVWRTPTELTFVQPATTSTSRELVRYSVPDKTATAISGGWPESIGNWLVAQQSKATPAPPAKQ